MAQEYDPVRTPEESPSSTYTPPPPTDFESRRESVYEPRRESTRGLLSQLVDEVTTLFRKEVELVRVEMSEAFSQAKTGITSVATGGAVLYAGFLVLLAAAVLGLANVVEPWLAALIVGAVVLIIGFIMLQVGKRKLEPSSFKPERTQSSLRKDKEMVQRRAA